MHTWMVQSITHRLYNIPPSYVRFLADQNVMRCVTVLAIQRFSDLLAIT